MQPVPFDPIGVQSVLGEAGLLIVACAVLYLVARAGPKKAAGGAAIHRAVLALAFAMPTVLFIVFPALTPQGAAFDLRAGPALLSGLIGGVPAALLTAASGAAARLALGGPFALGGALSVGIYCCVGLLARRLAAAPEEPAGPRALLTVALVGVLAALPVFFLGVPPALGLSALRDLLPFLLPGTAIAVLALGGAWRAGVRAREGRRRLEVLEAALDQAGNGILITDATPELAIVYANRAVTASTGYTPEELIGKTPRIFNEGLADQEGLEAVREAIRARRPCAVDLLNVRKDGGRFVNRLALSPICGETGETTHFVGIQDDVTVVREADHFVNLVTDRLPLALAFVGLNGVIKVANRAFAGRYGLSREAAIGRPVAEIVGEADHAALSAAMEAMLGCESVVRERDWRPAPDAPVRRLRDSLYPALTGRGQVRIGYVWAIEDITEQREAEEALRQAYKMHAIGNLTGGIAHDFNNLNAVVVGNLELLEAEGLTATQAGLLGEALSAAYRSAELTRSLLAFAQKAPLRPEAAPVAGRFAALESLLRASVPDSVSLDLRIAPDAGILEVDRSGFENAVLNLVLNARDAVGPGGGGIVVSARPVVLGERDTPRDGAFAGDLDPPAAGSYVAVSVRDSGCGVPPEIRATMLEPFATTKGPDIGTGLGLAMVHGFARQSGGFLRIADAVGGGTEATLYLPALGEDAATGESPAPVEPRSLRVAGRPAALVVEDEAAIRRLLDRRLSIFGFAVTCCATADEALARLQAGHPADLIVTDAVLSGGCQGPDLARAARRLRPGVRIILASGYRGALAGGDEDGLYDAYAPKPFTEATLRAAIEACMPPERLIVSAERSDGAAHG